MKNLFVLTVFLLLSFIGKAEKVVLFGSAKSYSGSTIRVMYHSDSFTYASNKITDFTVNENGEFRVEFDVDQTQLIYLPLEVYKAFLYVEPGQSYELKFPPKQELSPAQKLNPFFEADELMIGVANTKPNELNRNIRKLDDKLDAFINQNFHKIYRKKEKSAGIQFAQQLKEEFSGIKNEFFSEYFRYRLGFLNFLAHPNSFQKIENEFFKDQNIQLNNPAYMSLYKKQYGNFLNGYFKQKESLALSNAFKSENTYADIKKLMQAYPAYADTQLLDMIIATATFDSYTRKFIGKEKSLSIFQDILNASKNKYNQDLCRNYIAKITHLQQNYPAPDFQLGGVQLADYKGKYLYLNFCNTQSYPCLQDFKEIEKLKKQFGQHIEFLSIVCDWDVKNWLEFSKNNKYSWKFVSIADQHHLIHEYKVKAFPSYILIDPKGKIVKAAAQGPKENIHLEFIKIARDAARESYQR
ncbi:peroxiredoxin family protein [Marinifilum caeruleilacunae]|uniref:TlpA family protein disulfide reductase n=1 Tax=Marinifilum caeruleilacunae TaxID=2499076 RepID=A0ABX1WWG7_9BACT|nr:TlpA disulfide reductase family protein [Marinifilum caeruleilacunae]NOU60465.1 TlpA family protein disulfide reductase [Marinifilum caeruleilacunae]